MTDIESRQMRIRRALVALRRCEEVLAEMARRKAVARRQARRRQATRLRKAYPIERGRTMMRPGGDRGGR